MNAVRLATLGAALTLGISTAIVAQPPAAGTRPSVTDTTRRGALRGRGPRAHARRPGRGPGQALFRNVTLTTAQREQVQGIAKRYGEQRRALLQEARTTARDSTARAQLRTRARELQQRQMTETRGVLTADQRRAFDANVAKLRDRVAARPGTRGGAIRQHGLRRGARNG